MDARVEKILNLPAYQRILLVVLLVALIVGSLPAWPFALLGAFASPAFAGHALREPLLTWGAAG